MEVDGIRFVFPAHWQVCKWDDEAFHRRFQRVGGGSKACDIVALPPDGNEVWLIEVKDYRNHRRTKSADLFDEVGCKVRDTLAALWAAQRNAATDAERDMAQRARRRHTVRVAFHYEPFRSASRLAPKPKKQVADALDKLRQKVHAIDPHAVIVRTGAMAGVAWTAR